MCWGRIPGAVLALTMVASCRSAGPDVARAAPGCPGDLRALAGACVTPRLAQQACGARAVATLDGCSPRPPCAPGRARDVRSGDCLAARETRAIAAGAGVLVPTERADIVCPEGGDLTTGARETSTALGCLPSLVVRPARACPRGAVVDGDRCVPVVDGAGRVDVPAWVRSILGVDGGSGAASLCRGAQDSVAAIAAGGTASITVTVALRFPDNDVSQVAATVGATAGGAAVELEPAIAPLIEALRALGGTASQSEAGVRATCLVSSSRPAARIP